MSFQMSTPITPEYLAAVFAQRPYYTTAARSLAVLLIAALQVCSVRSDDTPAALNSISDTADRICGIVTTQGETHSSSVSGDVHAELSGLARYLASIGVSGAGEIASSNYQNVLQQDLPAALRDARDCKRRGALKGLLIAARKGRVLIDGQNPLGSGGYDVHSSRPLPCRR